MIIEMDDREPFSMMNLLNLECGKEIHIKMKRLKKGDYVCGDCIIERKTIDDFCSSVVDGRFKKQVDNMNGYKWKFVLVSGHIKDRHSEIHENCILGKIIGLILKHDVNVLMLDDDIQLAYMIKRIFERIKENESYN